jgi:anti-sigma B factor antagonist
VPKDQPQEATETIALSGEIDVAATEAVRTQLDAASAPTVRVDLCAVTFLDSTGLRVLIETAQRLAGEGRRLIVTNPPPSVRRVFDIPTPHTSSGSPTSDDHTGRDRSAFRAGPPTPPGRHRGPRRSSIGVAGQPPVWTREIIFSGEPPIR